MHTISWALRPPCCVRILRATLERYLPTCGYRLGAARFVGLLLPPVPLLLLLSPLLQMPALALGLLLELELVLALALALGLLGLELALLLLLAVVTTQTL